MDRLNRLSSVTQVPTTTGRSPLRKVSQSDSAFATLLTEKTLEEERRKRKKHEQELEEIEHNSQIAEKSTDLLSPIHPEKWGQKAEIPISDAPLRPQDIQAVKPRLNLSHNDAYKKSAADESEDTVLERKEEVRTPVRLPSERTMPLAAVEPLVDKKI